AGGGGVFRDSTVEGSSRCPEQEQSRPKAGKQVEISDVNIEFYLDNNLTSTCKKNVWRMHHYHFPNVVVNNWGGWKY
ncbi:hypothetical protein H5410_017620, partial [Solanum commersonii]